MSGQGKQLLIHSQAPDFHGLVGARRGQQPAVGTERNGCYRLLMTFERGWLNKLAERRERNPSEGNEGNTKQRDENARFHGKGLSSQESCETPPGLDIVQLGYEVRPISCRPELPVTAGRFPEELRRSALPA